MKLSEFMYGLFREVIHYDYCQMMEALGQDYRASYPAMDLVVELCE